MNNLPRFPVNYLEANSELLKSIESPSGNMPGATDYTASSNEPVVVTHAEAVYRAPLDRENGNLVFRRLPNGDLDLENAKHIVVDILHRVKDSGPLTTLEEAIVGCLYPLLFPHYVDPRLIAAITATQLRLAPWECAVLLQKVSAHLATEMSYNAGIGGGGDPGRVHTRA